MGHRRPPYKSHVQALETRMRNINGNWVGTTLVQIGASLSTSPGSPGECFLSVDLCTVESRRGRAYRVIGVMTQSAVGKSAVFLHGLGFSYASGVLEEECCFLESRVAISCQGRSQDFRKGGANLLVYDYITRAKKVIPRNPLIYYKRERLQ